MTTEARARLVEVMAKAAFERSERQSLLCTWETLGHRRQTWLAYEEAAIAAAERAGFKIEEIEGE